MHEHLFYIQPIADRVTQHLDIFSKNFQFSTRRTRILAEFINYYLVLIVNPMGRILVRWKSFRNHLEMLCHPICNWLYISFTYKCSTLWHICMLDSLAHLQVSFAHLQVSFAHIQISFAHEHVSFLRASSDEYNYGKVWVVIHTLYVNLCHVYNNTSLLCIHWSLFSQRCVAGPSCYSGIYISFAHIYVFLART